ncbi:MAG: peptidoglycan-binding protein [Propionibacteriaceae bacterium]|jgi:hypothetical protein|nr:peptidoglycan-binding protein [Propionibacteriaceae bacterium]
MNRLRVIVLAAVAAGAVGLLAGLWLVPDRTTDGLIAPVTAGLVEVAPRQFTDARLAPVKAESAPLWEALAPDAGVLRRSDCVVGQPLASGTSPFTLDDRPVVLLNLATPLWRDLASGDRGDDVAALQGELNRLGFGPVASTGLFGSDTARAVQRLWTKLGGDKRQTSLPLSQVVWSPQTEVTPTACPWSVGQRVSPDDVLFQAGGGLVALAVSPLPATAWPGPRLAVTGNGAVSLALPEDGVVTDPDFLAAYSQTSAFRSYLTDPATSLTVETRLAEPIEVVAAPAAALYDVSGGQACLATDQGPLRVEVVASEFGLTLVRADRLPERVWSPAGPAAEPCG